MLHKRFWSVATASFVGGGVALALVVPASHGQAPADAQGKDTRGKDTSASVLADKQADNEDPADDRNERGKHSDVRALTHVAAHVGGSRLGASVRDVTDEDATAKTLPAASGAVVTGVDEESPAAEAGIREGDVIVTFDDERVRSTQQLSRLVRETAEGRTVPLEVMRDGQRQALQVTPARREAAWPLDDRAIRDLTASVRKSVERIKDLEPQVGAFRIDPGDFSAMLPNLGWSGRRLGVSVQSLTPQLAEHFGVTGGVLITSVEADSPAAKAGVTAGDVVTAVNGTPVEHTHDLRRALQDAETREATLSVTRERTELSVQVTFPEPERWTHYERV